MENTNASLQYEQYFSLSIKGASHYDSGKPMQDYSMAARCEDHCIGIVCDGHGTSRHFRGDIGAKLATEVMFDILRQFAKLYPNWEAFHVDIPAKLEGLKIAVATCWQREIEAYTAEHPFTQEELSPMPATTQDRIKSNIAIAYGTTLLATLMCRDYYLVFMLGDGAVLKIQAGDPNNLVATSTGERLEEHRDINQPPSGGVSSLCSPQSYKNIFFDYGPVSEGLLFALCTDGISEAFTKDESLVRELMLHYANYLEVGLEQALIDSQDRLSRLSKMSANRDDISIAYVTMNEEAFLPNGHAKGCR